MYSKEAKSPKSGSYFLGNVAPRGPNFLGNMARGDFIGGQISWDTPLPKNTILPNFCPLPAT